MERDALVDFLNGILEPDLIEDATFNGLQVEGTDKINKICFAVDSCLPVFQKAAQLNCDMLVVHHGLIWGAWKNILSSDKQKLQILLENNINLYVSHLPLDKHFIYGNNVQIIKSLGASIVAPVLSCAYSAKFSHSMSYTALKALLKKRIGLKGEIHFGSEDSRIFAVSSGSFRSDWISDLHRNGIHTLITGEGSSPSLLYYPAQEYQMNILFGGHYATETFGVLALLELINNQYDELYTEFIPMETGW